MRKSLSLAFLVLLVVSIVQSCGKDEKDLCKDVVCLNDGTCANGACVCDEFYYGQFCGTLCVNGTYGTDGSCTCKDGYEGVTCETEVREKFMGNFQIYETCLTSSQAYEYPSTISAGSGLRYIEISNFRDESTYLPVVAKVVGETELIIEPQFPKGSQEVSGTGFINETRDTITIEYEFKASAGTNKEFCTLKFY